MATRLYPTTNRPEKLEILAGVPTGTYAKWAKLEADKTTALKTVTDPTATIEDIENTHWHRLQSDPTTATLDNFLTFGWGRIAQYESPCCSSNDPQKVTELLAAQQVAASFEQTEGLCWG